MEGLGSYMVYTLGQKGVPIHLPTLGLRVRVIGFRV